MSKNLNFHEIVAGADNSRAMETRDHSKKRGESEKPMSRGNFLMLGVFLVFYVFANTAVGQTWDISDKTSSGNNVTATLSGNTLTISGTGNMADFWSSNDWNGEAPWRDANLHLTIKTVEFQSGSSVKNIGQQAFNDCANLETIEIPNSVTKINARAFYYCTSLQTLEIPNSVTAIGGEAFSNCSSLETVTIVNGSANLNFNRYCISGSPPTVNDDCNSPNPTGDWFKSTPVKILHWGRDLTTWYASSNVRSPIYEIKESLSSLTIGSKVTTIGSRAFNDCTNLKTVKIEDGDATLTFAGVNTYGHFEGSNNITELYLGRDLAESSGNNGYPFSDHKQLKTVTIGENVKRINDKSFYKCTGLNTLIFDKSPDSKLEGIGSSAFQDCGVLNTDLIIPNKVQTIGNSAFQGCEQLPSVFIPYLVHTIGYRAFNECTGLKTVTIEEDEPGTNPNLTFAGVNTYGHFKDSKIEKLYLGRDLTESSGNNGYPFSDNAQLTSVTIGEKVTRINDKSFQNCRGLNSLIFLGNKILTIGSSAFYFCERLKTPLIIPNSVKEIGNSAFQKCSDLPSVSIPCSVIEIGYRAFNECTYLKTVTIEKDETGNQPDLKFIGVNTYGHFKDSNIADLYLGRNLTESSGNNGYPFSDNNQLKTVTIGEKVTRINDNSFKQCTGIITINSFAPEPPKAKSNCFSGVNKSNCKVYVPEYARCIYEEAEGWKEFENVIDGVTVSCDGSVLTISLGAYHFFASGGVSFPVHVYFNEDWKVTTDAPAWLWTTPENGNNNGTFTMTAGANINSSSRSATITVTGGGTSKTILVTQDGAGRSSLLNVLPEAYDFYASGGASSLIGVYSNQEWTISDIPSWLSTTSLGSNNNDTLSLNAEINIDDFQRKGSVTVTGDGISKTISITQDGNVPNASLHVSPEIYYFHPNGSKTTVIVSSTMDWKVSSNANDWLTISPNGSSNNGTFTMEATANTTSSSRSAVVSVTLPDGEMTRTICVMQGSNIGVGINEIETGQLKIYPNPVKDILTIEYEDANLAAEVVKIYDFLGKEVLESKLSDGKVNVSQLSSGAYILRIGGYSVKFVKE